jgi:hypothetical protein
MSKINKLIENGVKSLMIRTLEEKAVSKNQQQFMGMVHAYKKGEMKDAPASIKKTAKGMTKKAAKDFASTKHKGLPTRVDEGVIGDLVFIAGENNTFEAFIAELIKQKYIMPDELEDPETEKDLRAIYSSVTEAVLNEALAPTNDLKSKMPDHVKGWAKWVAQHANGEWWYYDSIPRLVPGTGWKNNDRDGYQFGSGIKTAPQGWEKSSQELKENKMNTKTESIVKRLKEDSEYQKFFKSAMDKFGIKSPKELSDKKKKEFFNYVDKNYKAKSEVKITEAYFPAHAQDSAELKKAKAALANWFNNIKSGDVSMRTKVQQLDVLSDLIDDYAYEYAQDWASGNMI